MPAKKIKLVSGRFRRKVPPALLMFADGRKLWVVFGLGLALFGIYGPVVGPPDNDGWRYLLGPLILPWLPAIYYFFRPIRPYSGYRGRYGDLTGMIDKDETDPEAARLSALFRSDGARRFMMRTALTHSAILFAPLALATLALGDSVAWNLWTPWLVPSAVLGLIGSTIAFFAEIIHWGVVTWGHEPAPE